VKLIDNFVENDNVYLVMEYCAEGSLKDYVSKHGPMGVLLGLFRLGVKFTHKFVLLLNIDR
jgi:serine/threonine protein kinase